MRSIAFLVVALVAFTPHAAASEAPEDEVMNLVAVRASDQMVLAWQPTIGAIEYGIFRATSEGEYVFLEHTYDVFYVDDEVTPGFVDYIVVVLTTAPHEPPAGASPQKSACLSASTSGVSLTAKNCTPSSVWDYIVI